MDLIPSLLTFCYVKDTFDKTGDLLLGFTPLFLPIASKLRGKPFDPVEFVNEVQGFYGISMPAPVAEELAVRLSRRGYLRAEGSDPYAQLLFYNDSYSPSYPSAIPNHDEIQAEIDALLNLVRDEFIKLFPDETDFPIEQSVLDALANLNFAKNIAGQRSASVVRDSKSGALEAIRIIVADYIFEAETDAKATGSRRFSIIQLISSGALLSQVILTIKNPPLKGVMAGQLTVYFDTPMVLQYFGFDGEEKRNAVIELMTSIKLIRASCGVYQQNVDEMTALLKAVTGAVTPRAVCTRR